MHNNNAQWKNDYEEQGYFVLRNYFKAEHINSLRKVILTFHENWKSENKQFYQEEAFNSSLITGSQYLNSCDRIKLFNFISSTEIMQVVESLILHKPAFMNTQLFFDPYNAQQPNFWHRDCQYDYDIEDQKKIIQDTQVVHFRVPLFDEPGMELVPGSHKRWDNEEEYEVRQEENNRTSCEALSTGKEIKLNAGDLLVFSADMIHRGLYGMDRLAFDILIFDSTGSGSIYADYVDGDCVPTQSQLKAIENPTLFYNTLALTT